MSKPNKPDTWMPLYIGDYLQDTTRLSTEQHGAYLLLIMDYWINGPLPDDDASLAQVARLQINAWKKHRLAIARLFMINSGEWRHKRIDEELEKARQFIAKQQANGSKGGRPKKTQTQTQDGSQKKPMGFDRDNPEHNPNESPSPSPTQSPVMERDTELSNGSAPVSQIIPTTSGLACKAMREEGIPDGNPMHPTFMALIEAGATEDEFREAAKSAIRANKPKFSYVVGIVKGQREDAARLNIAKPKQEGFENRNYGEGGKL